MEERKDIFFTRVQKVILAVYEFQIGIQFYLVIQIRCYKDLQTLEYVQEMFKFIIDPSIKATIFLALNQNCNYFIACVRF